MTTVALSVILSHVAGTSTYDAWNAYLDGKLGEMLAEYREQGLSFEQIARTLYRDHDIDVGAKTIGRWCERAAA